MILQDVFFKFVCVTAKNKNVYSVGPLFAISIHIEACDIPLN